MAILAIVSLTVANECGEMEGLHVFVELHRIKALVNVRVLQISWQNKWLEQESIEHFL